MWSEIKDKVKENMRINHGNKGEPGISLIGQQSPPEYPTFIT
jgi:hypothetical protein